MRKTPTGSNYVPRNRLLVRCAAAFVLSCSGASCTVREELPDAKIWFAAANSNTETLVFAQRSSGRVGAVTNNEEVRWSETDLDNEFGVALLPTKSEIAVIGSVHSDDDLHPLITRIRFYTLDSLKLKRSIDLPYSDHVEFLGEKWLAVYPYLDREGDEVLRRIEFWRNDRDTCERAFEFRDPEGMSAPGAVAAVDDHTVVLHVAVKKAESKEEWSRELAVLDLESQQILHRAQTRASGGVQVSRGGRYVALGSDQLVEVYSLPDLTLCGSFQPDTPHFELPGIQLAVSDDGNLVAWGRERVEVRDLRTGQSHIVDRSHETIVRSQIDLRQFTGGRVSAEDRATSEFSVWVSVDFCVAKLQFMANDTRLLALTRIGELRIWDVQDWKLLVNREIVHPRLHHVVLDNFARGNKW